MQEPPAFNSESVSGAYSYIQSLLGYLNTNYSNPSGADPFNSILPQQSGALTGDSSVTPSTSGHNNYNFAIARVRLNGTAGPSGAASNVRVFFRLWATQTADTDYQPNDTYLFNPDAASLPGSPKVGLNHHTIPFFASGNLNYQTDYNSGGVNMKDIQIDSGNAVWKYFGCFLNVYDPANLIDGNPIQSYLAGSHHCLVAQIAYDGTTLFTGETPETSDKLAQRNLSLVLSDNPGPADTHRIPQTFDARPSKEPSAGVPLDEYMIEWGKVPMNSLATIYWPQVQASQVIELANKMYRGHNLKALDSHTIQFEVIGQITYIPIPHSTGDNFAGLFTLDLPLGIKTGQEFNVVVRRLSTHIESPIRINSIVEKRKLGIKRNPVNTNNDHPNPIPPDRETKIWKYVVGSFQVKIPVTTGERILPLEENTLAIMKWRLKNIKTDNRWYPVLVRYIDTISKRINGLGGDAEKILPSLDGVPGNMKPHHPNKNGEKRISLTGKVGSIIFDRYGDFDGFILQTEDGNKRFSSKETQIFNVVRKAWEDRILITVMVEKDQIHRPEEIIFHLPPFLKA